MTIKDIKAMPLGQATRNQCQFGCCKAAKSDILDAKRTGRMSAHETEDGGCHITIVSNNPHDNFSIIIPAEAY